MKCAVASCSNEAVVHVTETENDKGYDICKSCFEREDYYEILGVGYYQKTWQVGTKHRPLEIVA